MPDPATIFQRKRPAMPREPSRKQAAKRAPDDAPPVTINACFLVVAKVSPGASRPVMQHRLEVALSDLGDQIIAVVPVT